MPLPFIVIAGIIAAAGGLGISAVGAISASSDNDEAKKNNDKANSIVEEAKAKLEKSRNICKNALENLGKEKIEILQTSITTFISLFEKIKNIELQDSAGLQELSKFKIDKHGIIELKEATLIAESVAKGIVSGSVAGGAIAFGAWSAATAFASASTGTAIATLSGAAATNATLAFFGGGAIAAGGLGMAAGTAVLGGLVAGPALAVLGVVMAVHASENLDKSKVNVSEAQKFREEVGFLCDSCEAILQRANLFFRIMSQLNCTFVPMLKQMEAIIDLEGTDYSKYSDGAKKTIAASLSLAQAIKATLDTPLLAEDGKLTEESKRVSDAICKQYEITA